MLFYNYVINVLFSDLAEVQSVTAAQPTQIGTKRVDEKGFFDVSIFFNVKKNLFLKVWNIE